MTHRGWLKSRPKQSCGERGGQGTLFPGSPAQKGPPNQRIPLTFLNTRRPACEYVWFYPMYHTNTQLNLHAKKMQLSTHISHYISRTYSIPLLLNIFDFENSSSYGVCDTRSLRNTRRCIVNIFPAKKSLGS